jgi:hypothetical protein
VDLVSSNPLFDGTFVIAGLAGLLQYYLPGSVAFNCGPVWKSIKGGHEVDLPGQQGAIVSRGTRVTHQAVAAVGEERQDMADLMSIYVAAIRFRATWGTMVGADNRKP